MDQALNITPRQRALLALMLLRGPQTAPELLARSDRLAEFPSLDDVRSTLDRLAQREPALAIRIPRSGGQREDRYMHLLCGDVDVSALARAAPPDAAGNSASALESRIEQLESLVDALQTRLQQVESRFEVDED